MFQRLNIPAEAIPRTKFRLHIVIGTLILLTFILAIVRIADSGTPSSRTNTWGIAVCLKSAVFMAYQITTAHIDKLKRWANTKVNVVLNVIDTVFWFALFVITIMGAQGSHSTSSKALGAIIIILALILCGLAGFLSFACIKERRYYKQHGMLPGKVAQHTAAV
ncbi:hypothetical protein BJX63DRAFT_426988 [Aspergillus granulosus]|uniref:MARVEL domain-containing protein n=1 Tax=Aspergillus granulosus TaxID=176169 RepID=A0ABR4I629_9EURO